MEPLKLSPALLQPQVTVVAILGKLLATLPRLDDVMLLKLSPSCLYWGLVDFTRDLQATLYSIDDIWWHHNVTSDDDPVTSLSQALAAYKSTPWTPQNHVIMAASKWQGLVAVIVDRWVQLARAATKLHNACREVVRKAAHMEADAATSAKNLQDRAAHYGTARENMMELGQALSREEGDKEVARREAWVSRQAREVARKATKAAMVRQRMEVAVVLLERLVAACDEATTFPRELHRLLRDIEDALKGTNEVSPDIPEALVSRVAVAEQLWEANTRLAKDHLLGTLPDTTKFYINGRPTGPSACEVAERCQRATEDIPRLLQPLEHPQSVPKVSPVSMELRELSPTLLQPQVTVVAILGDLLATLPKQDKMQFVSARNLYEGLVDFTTGLRATLYSFAVPSNDDDPVTSLSRALATYKSIPWSPQNHGTLAASKWQRAVAVIVNSWTELARAATKLFNTCRKVGNEAADMVASITARARELQDEAANYGTAQENMMELGQATGGEEGAEEVAGREAWVRRQAMVTTSEAKRASMVRKRMEEALGLLERLVAVCDKATAFPRELQCRLEDIEADLRGTNEASPNVPEALVAKVAETEQLLEANAHLAKDHLVGTLDCLFKFYINGGPTSPSACEVAERCQRAIEDIPRLLRPLESPQNVPMASPGSMELQELSLALLQPQVTVVAILGKLLAILPKQDERQFMSPRNLFKGLVDFTRGLRATLYCIDDTWWRHNIICDDDPVTSLSQALADCQSIPWVLRNHVIMAASKWQGTVDALVNCWAEQARAATKLRNTCREEINNAADRVAYLTTRARELQDEAANYGTVQENMVELDLALGREEEAEEVACIWRQAREAASEATTATMMRQRVEAALGLLEHLVAACDKATVFPRELQRLLRDIKATLEGTNEVFLDVPEDLVSRVTVAERLWEANALLVKDHLVGTLQDIKFYFDGGPTITHSLSACEVAERCQRATEDIQRLLRPRECPQSVPKVSPVSVELQELSPALLQPQVTVVAILGELLATLPRLDEMMLPVSALRLYWDLVDFTKELQATLYGIDDTWWCHNVICDDDDPVTFLSRALAAYRSTPWTTWDNVTMAARDWGNLVAGLEESWDGLAWVATNLRNNCRRVAAEAADIVAFTTAWARNLQDKAARYGTAQENMVQLGRALGGEEGAEEVARHEAWVRRQAKVADSRATMASMVRQWVEVALGPLERLADASDKATVFPRELQRRVLDIEVILEETDEESPDVPEDLVSRVAEAERLWEANTRLAKDHLLGTVHDIIKFYFDGGPNNLSASGVAERCQRAIEDMPRLLRPQECPQSVPKVSPVSMELQKPSQLLEAHVSMVATLGEVLATMTRSHWGMWRCVPPKSLHTALGKFTSRLRETLDHSSVTSLGNSSVPSLRRALAALGATPGTTWANVRIVASAWLELVAKLTDSCDQLARAATELREKVDQQLPVAPDKEEVAQEMASHNAQVVAATNETTEEAVVTRQAREDTRRGHWAVVAKGPLQRLVATCNKATLFNWNMEWRLRDIEATLKGTNEVSPDVLQSSVAKVAEFECLWEASACLANDHLLSALSVIDNILLSLYGGRSVLGGPSIHAVFARCQKAIKDIPRLLGQ